MIIGSTGYIGTAFMRECEKRRTDYSTLSHEAVSFKSVMPEGTELVVNCAAYIPRQSVSLCDQNQAETIRGNILFPAMLSHWCHRHEVPLAHISTGCLWSDGKEHSEDDPIQRAFTGYCGFYVGTKVLSEEEVRKYNQHYIWRIRLPFDEQDSDRNYLSKLARFPEVFDHNNTVSHRSDFAKSCLDLWNLNAPFGTYNVMNPGSIKARTIIDIMLEKGIRKTRPSFVTGKQGDCQVSVQKIMSLGVKIRPVEEAIDEALSNWKS